MGERGEAWCEYGRGGNDYERALNENHPPTFISTFLSVIPLDSNEICSNLYNIELRSMFHPLNKHTNATLKGET